MAAAIAAAYGQNAPTVTLAAPAGTSVNRTVALTATPTAAAGVARVEFLVDGAVIATVTAAPYTANWDTSTTADGVHSLTARVTDAANAVATSAAVAVTVNNNPVINLFLTPDEVFPRPTSIATGLGQLTFNLITGAITGGVSLTGVTATLAHIHQAYAGSNGPVIINFAANATDPNRWEPVAGSLLTAEQVTDLLAGKLYVNVHSAAFPDGEIRSQIKPADVTVVFTPLNGASVVPPVATTASGVAATTMDVKASLATVHLNVTGADDATEAHVHIGAPGTNAATALLFADEGRGSAGTLVDRAASNRRSGSCGVQRQHLVPRRAHAGKPRRPVARAGHTARHVDSGTNSGVHAALRRVPHGRRQLPAGLDEPDLGSGKLHITGERRE